MGAVQSKLWQQLQLQRYKIKYNNNITLQKRIRRCVFSKGSYIDKRGWVFTSRFLILMDNNNNKIHRIPIHNTAPPGSNHPSSSAADILPGTPFSNRCIGLYYVAGAVNAYIVACQTWNRHTITLSRASQKVK